MRHSKNWGMLWAALAGFGFGDVGTAQEPEGFFGEPVPIDVGVGGNVYGPTTSADELTLYFSRFEGNIRGDVDIYFMTRESKGDPFVTPARPLEELNSHPFEDWVGAGSLSADGSEIYFSSTRPGGLGGGDIWVARFTVRGHPEEGFERPVVLDRGINTTARELISTISRDGRRLYFRRDRRDLYVAMRDDPLNDSFGNPVFLNSRLGAEWVFHPCISSDELTLLWGDSRDTSRDVWMATRESIFDGLGQPVPFDDPVPLGPSINTGANEYAPTLTAHWPAPGSSLYFGRDFTSILRATWHPDCNQNQIDDSEEIEAGDVEDVDMDGVPDECDR